MNVLTTANSIATMTSREIAELTKKPHDNVLKLVRSLIDMGIVKNTTPHEYIHPQNKQIYIEFFADKRLYIEQHREAKGYLMKPFNNDSISK